MCHKPRPVEPHAPTADTVGHIEMPHRLAIFAQIVEQFPDGEMQKQAVRVAGGRVAEGGKHPHEPRTVRFGAFSDADRGEMRRNLERVQGECAIAGFNRLFEASSFCQDLAEGLVEFIVARIERYGLPQPYLRFVEISPQQQGSDQVEATRRGVRGAYGRTAEVFCGFLDLAGRLEQLAEQAMSLRHLRRQFDRAATSRYRFAIPAQPV